MNREEAKIYIRRNWREALQEMGIPAAVSPSNGEQSYICPLCGHGSHGDGMTFNPYSADQSSLKCFGCGFSGDVIDLYREQNRTDYNTALRSLGELLRISIDQYSAERYTLSNAVSDFSKPLDSVPVVHGKNEKTESGNIDTTPEIKNENTPIVRAQKRKYDFREYYARCAERITDPVPASYLQGRGISIATAQQYGLGFDPAADPANNPGADDSAEKSHPCPRIILPVTSGYYVGRATKNDSTVKGQRTLPDGTIKKYDYRKLNPTGADSDIFNISAIYAESAVFVTEGIFDALSIIEAGAAAIALNSVSNAGLLLKRLQERRPEATLILCLDNDEKGKKAKQIIREGLQRMNISFITADICCGYKDQNDALVADKAAFRAAVAQAEHMTAERPDNTELYINSFLTADIERFRADKKTGYDNLDQLTGGLYAGLYCIAALSSLGKTTFALQMADQIAAAGNDVIFFSLEQSKLELVSKSFARITAQQDMKTAVSSLAIRKGYKPPQLLSAVKEYIRSVGNRLSIVEGDFSCNVSFIGDYIRNYALKTGASPVVIIDYLQILQPETEENGRKQSTKETVDTTVTTLKRISRELNIPIIAISSVNRGNYLTPIDFESLKESGSIEYTCDVIWGLQYQILNDDIFNQQAKIKEKRELIRQAKNPGEGKPRKIELKCLKNRYGRDFSCYFDYYPANDLYTVCTEPDKISQPDQPVKKNHARYV